jgi:hypothetical protein
MDVGDDAPMNRRQCQQFNRISEIRTRLGSIRLYTLSALVANSPDNVIIWSKCSTRCAGRVFTFFCVILVQVLISRITGLAKRINLEASMLHSMNGWNMRYLLLGDVFTVQRSWIFNRFISIYPALTIQLDTTSQNHQHQPASSEHMSCTCRGDICNSCTTLQIVIDRDIQTIVDAVIHVFGLCCQ